MPDNNRYLYMAKVFKAMSHPTRLFILDKLNEGNHCVGELQEMVGIDMSTMSRHLSVLREAGIIAGEKRNNMVIYKLLCPCVLDMYHCVHKIKHPSAENE